MIRDGVTQLESTESVIGDIEPNFLCQPPLRFDPIQISEHERFEYTDRAVRWSASYRIVWREQFIAEVNGYHPVDFPRQAALRNP